MNEKEFLDLEETVAYTGFSKYHVYRLAAKGLIPCYKPGGKKLVFVRDELRGWMLSKRREVKI